MSTQQQDDRDRSQQQPGDRSPQDSDIWMKTYRYLRVAMVLLLVALGGAVIYESCRQKFLLGSVSAYYYTPAQAIFVGALIGLCACMIALKGTTPREDIFLNLGGMSAAVVAIVPTSRGDDYNDAIRACGVLDQKTAQDLDCRQLKAFEEAAKANIDNNMFTLLLVGSLAVVAALIFISLDRRRRPEPDGAPTSGRQLSWPGFYAALAVLAVGWVAFYRYTGAVIHNAHWAAALSLFLFIFLVAYENARRRLGKQTAGAPANRTANETVTGQPVTRKVMETVVTETGQAVSVLLSRRREWYTNIAQLLLLGGGFAILGFAVHWFSLFWAEIVVFVLFAAFWLAQTIEQDGRPPGTEPPMGNARNP